MEWPGSVAATTRLEALLTPSPTTIVRAALLGAVTLLASVAQVAAHADLESSDPADGVTLEAPSEVSGVFTEPLDPADSRRATSSSRPAAGRSRMVPTMTATAGSISRMIITRSALSGWPTKGAPAKVMRQATPAMPAATRPVRRPARRALATTGNSRMGAGSGKRIPFARSVSSTSATARVSSGPSPRPLRMPGEGRVTTSQTRPGAVDARGGSLEEGHLHTFAQPLRPALPSVVLGPMSVEQRSTS